MSETTKFKLGLQEFGLIILIVAVVNYCFCEWLSLEGAKVGIYYEEATGTWEKRKSLQKGWAIRSPHTDSVLLHTVNQSGERAWENLVGGNREEREHRVNQGYKVVKVTVTEGWGE